MCKFFIVLAVLGLSGCVTDSPDTLLGVGDAPIGAIQKEGNYPVINQTPKGQTKQFTQGEKAALKKDTGVAVQKAEKQAAEDSTATYLKEVEAMKKLAKDAQEKRLADIESRKYQQD